MITESNLLSLAGKALQIEHVDPYLDHLYGIYPGCDYYRLAYLLARELKEGVIVELGTQYARCAAHFAAASEDVQVYTIDVEECSGTVRHYDNLTFIRARTEKAETAAPFEDGSVDICFADSTHNAGHVLREIEAWTPKMTPGALWLFDDLREMPDLLPLLPFEVKGTLPGIHTTPVGPKGNQRIEEVGFGYAFVGEDE